MFRFPEQEPPLQRFCVEVVLETPDRVFEDREKQPVVRRSSTRRIVLHRHEDLRRQDMVFVLLRTTSWIYRMVPFFLSGSILDAVAKAQSESLERAIVNDTPLSP